MPLHLRLNIVVGDWEVENMESHLVVPESVPTVAVPEARWADNTAYEKEPALSAVPEDVAIGVLSQLVKDVVASAEMLRNVELIQDQEVPVQFAFGVSPPPSPRGPAATAVARDGPTDPGDAVLEPPPAPTPPVLEMTDEQKSRAQKHKDKTKEKLEATGRVTVMAAPSLEHSISTPEDSKEEEEEDNLDRPLLFDRQDQPNFRLAVATVLRQALQTTIGDAIDGRSLGDSTWVD
jgi:hypothetical protein